MAFSDYAAYKSSVGNQSMIAGRSVLSMTVVAGRIYDTWVAWNVPGTTPTTAAVPTNTTTGSFLQNDGGGTLCIASATTGFSSTSVTSGAVIVADRLSHQGGLSGTVTTEQTTNLPTSALTRYTSGEGVMIGLTIYTQIGTTGTTVTASYTNQAGTAGKTTAAVVLGGTGFREANRMVLLPLAAGDTGARSVESVTVLATTGTAGNFGVTLFKPLLTMPFTTGMSADSDFVTGAMLGGLPEIVDGSCLWPIYIATTTAATGNIILNFAEH